MKVTKCRNRNRWLGIETSFTKFAFSAFLVLAANVAFGQTTRSWTGGAGDFKLATAGNWNPSGSPAGGSSDILQWDGTAATGNLLVTNASALDTSPGLNLNVTADHTGSLTIVGTARLRLNANSLTIASGAGAFSFGYGAPVAFPIPLAATGGGAIHAWINNSAYAATINSEVYFLMGGGGAHTLALGGTGNWNVYSQLQAQNSGAGLALTVNGSGTVVYAPTNAPGTTYGGVFNGITVTSGTLKLGNAAASSGTITVNGGTLDINGFSITNNLSGAGSIDTTAAGGTPVLTISNANNPTISGAIKNTAGTLSLVKRGAGTLTLAGANTYSGATTVSAGTVIVNGSIGSGDVTVASGAGFGGGGSIGGNVTWQVGSSASFVVTNTGSGNGTPLLIGGIATLNNNAVSVNVLGTTPLPLGTYTLMNATGGGSGSFVTTLTAANFTGAGVAPGTAASISMSGGVATLHVDKIGTDSTWINDLAGGAGTWSTSSSWENGYVPSLAGDVAILGVGSSVSTVTLDANISLGGINFTNPNSFIIADAGNTMTLDAKGNGVTVTVSGGASNSVASAVSLNDKVTCAVAGGASLSLSGVVSASSTGLTVTKNGNGTLVISGNNTYGPAAGSIGTVLGGGNLEIANSHALGAGDLTNSANATLTFGTAVTLPNKIWINSASTLTLNDQGNTVAFTGGFGGAGSLYKNSAGLNVITNNGTSTIATITVTNGTLEIASNTTVLATGQLFVDNGGTLQVDAGATLSYTASGFGFIGNTTGAIATNIINGTLNYSNANFVVARSGGGNMTINSGRFLCNNFFVGQSSAADSGYLYLNGGSLIVNNVQSGGGANYFYFNGGALVAKAASTTFWANNAALNAYVQSSPGTIDNGGNAITVSQPINSETGTDGGMIFRGTNVTTLASANGYNGPTAVDTGTLLITGSIGGGNVTVASGAALGGTGTVGGNVTFQAGSSVLFVITNTGSGNGTPFNISGAVTLNNNAVKINVAGSTPLPVGIYTLMNCGGNTGSFAVTPTFTGAGVAGGTVSTVSIEGGVATLTVLVGGNTWAHDGNGNWSTAANWSANPVIPRLPGDPAIFGVGSAFTTVTLDTNVSVGSISFTNPLSFLIADAGKTLTLATSSGNLAMNVSGGQSNSIAAPVVLNGAVGVSASGAAGLSISGKVSGAGSIVLGGDGSGFLTLGGSNTYSGGTVVGAGTLALASTNAMGTNTLTLNGGHLDSAVTNLVNANNNPQIWLGSFGFLGSQNLNLGTGSVAVSNNVTVSVTNKLVVGGTINASAFTVTLIGDGTVELDANNSIGGLNSGVNLLVFGNDNAAGNGILNSYSPTAAFASSSSATRTIHNILGTGNGANGWTFSGTGNLIFDGGVISYNFGKTVTVNNPVTTWNFALPSGAGGTFKQGAGTFVLSGANANTGGNTVNAGTLALNNVSALGTGTLVMNGGNLDCLVANMTNVNNNVQTWNTNFTFLGSQDLNLGNGAVTMASNITVTINANVLTVEGAIDDGGLAYALGKSGSGLLRLTGANTYTGNTLVHAGTLELANPTLAAGSTVEISAGATLRLDFSGMNTVTSLVLNGVIQPAGIYGSSTPGGFIAGTGSLQVTTGPAVPPMLTSTVNGSTLQLSWPADPGLRLQMQTNSLSVGLGGNWIDVTDGTTSSTNIIMDSTKGAVFFRLIK